MDADSNETGRAIITRPAAVASAEADMTAGAQRIADEINAAHRRAQATADDAIAQAIECGKLLIAQKARVGHGNFMKWIADHCAFEQAQANNYMLVARNPSALGKSKAMRRLYASGRQPARSRTTQPEEKPSAMPAADEPRAVPTDAGVPGVEITVERATEILRRSPDFERKYGRILKSERDARKALERAQVAYNNAVASIIAAARKIEQEARE